MPPRRRRHHVLAAVAVAMVAPAACGADPSADELPPPRAEASSAPSVHPTVPTRPTLPPSPSLPAPVAGTGPLVNVNDPDQTELGRLCWARREVVLSLSALVGADTDAASLPDTLDRVADVMADDDAALAPLPESARPFHDAFVDGVGAARAAFTAVTAPAGAAEQLEVGNTHFAFDGYPGAADYVAAATADPSCQEP